MTQTGQGQTYLPQPDLNKWLPPTVPQRGIKYQCFVQFVSNIEKKLIVKYFKQYIENGILSPIIFHKPQHLVIFALGLIFYKKEVDTFEACSGTPLSTPAPPDLNFLSFLLSSSLKSMCIFCCCLLCRDVSEIIMWFRLHIFKFTQMV